MNKWEEKRLGDIVTVNPKMISKNNFCGEIQYIDISSVNQGKLKGYKIYDINDAPSRARRSIRPNDIIYSTVRPNLKAYYYVKRDCPNNAIASTGFAVIRSNKEADSKFIYYLITENSFIEYLSIVAKGTAYPAVDSNDFKNAKVKIPELSTQKRIANILSVYDELIENNNRRIEILEKVSQDLYKEWFVRFRFPGYRETKFKNGIPEGWMIEKLGAVVNITSSKRVYLSDYVSEGVPFYRSKEIIQLSNGKVISDTLYISNEKYNEIKNKYGVPKKNDILLTSVGTIGIPMLVSNNNSFYFKDGNLTWIQSSLKERIAIYLYLWIKSEGGYQQLLSSTIGTSQSALTIEKLKNIKILKPSEDIILKFSSLASNFIEEINNLQTQNINLIKQRDLLLPRLMSGKLRV